MSRDEIFSHQCMVSVAIKLVWPGYSIWSLDSVGLSPGRIAAKSEHSGVKKRYCLALSKFSLLSQITQLVSDRIERHESNFWLLSSDNFVVCLLWSTNHDFM